MMVPQLERSEYASELRNVVENIAQERLEHFEVHPPTRYGPVTHELGEVQESFHETSGFVGNAEASEVDQPPPQTPCAAIGSPSPTAASQGIPTFVIPMTQGQTLEGLPSQLEFDWQDSVSPNPTPAVAAPSVGSPKAMEVDEFVGVSQIAEEAVKNATQQAPQQEMDPLSTDADALPACHVTTAP